MSDSTINEGYDRGYAYAIGYKTGRDRGYTKGRADAFNKIMPIFLDILDEKFHWHEKANEIDELEKEWNKLKEEIERSRI